MWVMLWLLLEALCVCVVHAELFGLGKKYRWHIAHCPVKPPKLLHTNSDCDVLQLVGKLTKSSIQQSEAREAPE